MSKAQNIYKTFAYYVSFNILSMIGLSCFILADTYFISNGIGSMGLTALNIVLPVYSLLSGIGLMLGMGSAIQFSILRGERNKKDASICFTHAITLGIFFGICFTLVGFFFSYDIAKLLGADPDVIPLAGKYLKTILLFSLAFIINQIFVCFVRNDEQPNLAMLAMICGSLSNIILDYIFIFPLKMGMFGAAFATGLSPIISLLVLSFHRIKQRQTFHFIKCTLTSHFVAKIVSLGLPSFVTEFSSGLIMLIFNFLILKQTGSIGVAAYGIIANIALVVVAIFTGIAQGIQPIISLNLGSKNMANIKKIFICAIGLSAILGTFFYLIGLLFSNDIISIFNQEQNIALEKVATQGVSLYFTAFIIMGINIVTSAFFAALSRPFQSFLISITRGCLAVIPFAFLLSHFFQMTGIWITIPCAEIITLIFSIFFLWKFSKT